MSKFKSIYQRVYKTIRKNERFCLLCNKSLEEDLHFLSFWEEDNLCLECQKKLKGEKRVYNIDGKEFIVLHEYNEFIERTLFRFKEQRDIALAPIFLSPYQNVLKKLRSRYIFITLCSSEEKRSFRAFEPMVEWFSSVGIPVYSPFYKNKDWKQSNYDFKKRKEIGSVLQRKTLYDLPNRPKIVFDDVLTSGASIKRAMELENVEKVIVYAAHPMWIQQHEKDLKSCEKK